jgi:hypothetical protein
MDAIYGESKLVLGVGIKQKVLLTGAAVVTATLVVVSTGEELNCLKAPLS